MNPLSTDVFDLSGFDAVDSLDLVMHLYRQRSFSERTFGPGRTGAPDFREHVALDHIRKELGEIEREPNRVEEWIDAVILALDGAWRTGASPEQIAEALASKQRRNEARTWPDWRTAEPGKAIEHLRSYQFCRSCRERKGDCHCEFLGETPDWETRDEETHQPLSGDLLADLAASDERPPSEDAIAQELIARLVAQPDGGDALLRVLLRADPDRAVRVVDGARIARPWSEDDDRMPLAGGPFVGVLEVFPATTGAPWQMVEWDARDEDGDTIADGTCSSASAVDDARKALDAALTEDGWVLAGGAS